ncbi:DUF2752 domain-containing protein [Aureivirga sp. CE67]|uniref:DUF2752 domain-containing protein n=1 Tax=Aureivirga sp. CE67 TaxID=1788983 RepID=UPI0018CB69BE
MKSNISFCFYKNFFSIPCPSCGSTRSLLAFLKFNIYEALIVFNPLGVFYFILLIVIPLMIIFDIIFKKELTLRSYLILIEKIKNKKFWIPFSVILILNWIWNFYKGL